jgi:hypothetical protein
MADVAGPLSAGRPEPAGARAMDGPPRAAEPGPAVTVVPAARPPGLAAQLTVLIRRDAEVLARDRRTERGLLRGERASGLRPVAFVLAKTAVLLPLLALADALILAVPEIAGWLRDRLTWPRDAPRWPASSALSR